MPPRARNAHSTPLVTVFTASHDIGSDIDTAYRSLLRQSYPTWEWVVVDDSPNSATADHVTLLAAKPDAASRIRLYAQVPPTGSVP